MLLAEEDGEVGVLDGEEDLVHVGPHVALLQQGRAQGRALGPLRNLLLRVVLVIGIGPRVKILQP